MPFWAIDAIVIHGFIKRDRQLMQIQSQKMVRLCALSLALWLWTSPAQAQQIINPVQPSQTYSASAFWNDLSQARVIYLGEMHDRLADHEAQLEIIQQLHQQNPRLAIGMEMFQRPYQPVIDRYLAGEISETELRQQTQFDRRWGFPWSLYAPILRFAKEQQISVLALNVPSEVSRRVAQKGLNGLTANDRQWIPPVSEIRTDNAAYRSFLRQIYDEFHEGHGNSDSFDRFVLAQVLWDETMAERVAQFVQTHPQHQVVVLAGQGHVMYGYGIPSRVTRRIPGVRQRSILLNPDEGRPASDGERAIADYVWRSQ